MSEMEKVEAPTTLTGYLQAVSDYWMNADRHDCAGCDMHDDGYCAMLHDRSVPDGDCNGLLKIHGWKQPAECDHDWRFVEHSYEGDPNVINGTRDFRVFCCKKCGAESTRT